MPCPCQSGPNDYRPSQYGSWWQQNVAPLPRSKTPQRTRARRCPTRTWATIVLLASLGCAVPRMLELRELTEVGGGMVSAKGFECIA